MKREYKKLDIDKIESLQDEMSEMLDLNTEIQDAMSRQYDTPDVCYYKEDEFLVDFFVNLDE
jgi:charged multivesicular body protein 5